MFNMMKSTCSYLILSVLILVGVHCNAQLPQNDANWNSTPYFADEFDDIIKFDTVWNYSPPWGSCHQETALTTSTNNRFLSNGKLNLKIIKENKSCTNLTLPYLKPYSAGAAYSKRLFKYGYFEVLCKLPVDTGSIYNFKGIGPNFWLFPVPDTSYFGSVKKSEIDIFEFLNGNYTYSCNIHFQKLITNTDTLNWDFGNNIINSVTKKKIDFSVEHKFGCQWSPNTIIFYIDDKQIATTDLRDYCSGLIPMNIILDINLPTESIMPNSSTKFPYTYPISYVRVYKLKMDCNTDVTQSAFNYSTFDNKVKRNITVGGTQGLMPVNTIISLRAVQAVTLNDGFEVPIGSEFFASNNDCEF